MASKHVTNYNAVAPHWRAHVIIITQMCDYSPTSDIRPLSRLLKNKVGLFRRMNVMRPVGAPNLQHTA